jgi:hypothetical protein
MRYHFHLLAGNTIDYDTEGLEFSSLEAARDYGVRFLEDYFLNSTAPAEQVRNATLCITDSKGKTASLPFADFMESRFGYKRAA